MTDILQIIDQLAAANVHQVELTGGEPFLRQDLLEIMDTLVNKQIAVSGNHRDGSAAPLIFHKI